MKTVKIVPSVLKGEIKVPPSKSIAHRAIICAGLSKGRSYISNIDSSDDILSTIGAMKLLGSEIILNDDTAEICGDGFLSDQSRLFKTIDCMESGSTLRFILPVSIVKENNIIFTGRGNLWNRPINPYIDLFDLQGIKYQFLENNRGLKVLGSLKAADIKVPGDISSQFITGLLFALPMLNGNSKILITGKIESCGYIDLTLDVLKKFGIEIRTGLDNTFYVNGNQSFMHRNYIVEGDYTQAAFYLSAGALGSNIKCRGLNINSLQGDKAIIDILNAIMPSNFIEINNDYIRCYSDNLVGTIIDGSMCPDIIPDLAVVASLSVGVTHIINSSRLRLKECDRLKAITSELSKLGADIKETDDGLIINGKKTLKGGSVDSFGDHRIAMALALAATRCSEPVIISGSDSVKKSYPNFWRDFKQLGGIIDERDMG